MREFSCEQCGFILKGISPDDLYTVFSIIKLKDDCIKTIYKCEDCGKEITRYWCTPDQQLAFSVSSSKRH